MGTRGLLGHIIRGKKKASYNHFDSYPAGLGVKLAAFIKSLSEAQIKQMIENLEKIEWVNERSDVPHIDLQALYLDAGFADLGVADQTAADWYCLLNKVQGAAALPQILNGKLSHLIDSTSFEEDSLFCEWVYIVDWVKREVGVKGNNGYVDIDRSVSFDEVSEDWMLRLDREGQDDQENDGQE